MTPLALRDCMTTSLQESLTVLSGKRLPVKLFAISGLSLHGRLFVRGNLKYLSVSDRKCPLGSQQGESMEHFISECRRGRNIWKDLSGKLKISRLQSLPYTDIIYGVAATNSNIDRGQCIL